MSFLIPFLTFRLDTILFAGLSIFAALLCRSTVQHRRPGCRLPTATWWILTVAILLGAAFAEWAADARRESLQKAYSTLGPTYALELQKLGHANIEIGTPRDDPGYLALIDAQKNWLRVNPFVSDIYTFRRHDDRRVAFIVDSETDYNRDGMFDGDREQRTAIGEIYEETTPEFLEVFQGQSAFDATFQADRWGLWVSSLTPIYDELGRVEAGVGLDFSATEWAATIVITRALILGGMLAAIVIFLFRQAFVTLVRAEVHHRQNTEHELHRAVTAVEHATNAKGEFLAVMSHEIRTPLTAVLGFASVLSETKLDSTQRRYVDTIISAGDRLVAMLNDVLDLSKIEEGKLALDSIAWSPVLLINEIVDVMTPAAMEKGLRLRCDQQFSDSLAVEGDPARVRQILVNLLSNAVKFTDRGDVTLRGRWIPPDKGAVQGKLILEIQDTGIGIPSDKLAGLFKQLSQIHGQNRRYNGAGLGLAICKRLVDLMHGTIVVESLFGHGSRFIFTLPTAPAQLAQATDSTGPGASSTAGSTPPMRGRALVVDDHVVNRELLKIMLRRQGYLADLATNGTEAIALTATNTYSIIFMDLEMPGMNGYETTQKIRATQSPRSRIPIIAVTATTAKGTREKCLAAGMDEYLTKPVYLPALKSTLEAVTAPAPLSRSDRWPTPL
jgi:signal transduction histidine kinase/CheY-like chemotaxis protein